MNTSTIDTPKIKSVCPTIIYTIGSHAMEVKDETQKIGKPFTLPDNCQVIFYSEKNYCLQIEDDLINDIAINATTYRESIHEIYSNKNTYRKSCNPSIDKVIHRIKFNYGRVPNYILSIIKVINGIYIIYAIYFLNYYIFKFLISFSIYYKIK